MIFFHGANYIGRTPVCWKLYLCVSYGKINTDFLPKNINPRCVLCEVGPEIFNII